MSRTISLTVLLMVVLGVFAVEPAVAGKKKPKDKPVTCGDVIDTPGNYFLSGDCNSAGITITVSRVTLNLKGHTMSGFGFFSGIYVNGVSNVKIIGPGTIESYVDGITFTNVSDSEVQKVSFDNILTGVTLDDSTDNEIEKSVFSFNADTGVQVIRGSDNKIEGNKVNDNGTGIAIDESTGNEVKENTANSNDVGIVVRGGCDNKIEGNKANDNIVGILITNDSTGNEVKENTANDNSENGIFVDSGSTGNEIEENRARNNGLKDLHDENAVCDNNDWQDNRFNSANQPCID